MQPRISTLLFAAAALLAVASPARAQTTVQKHVSWNVDPLVGHPAGPYALNFQLVDGAGTGNGNALVTVSNAPFAGFSFNNNAFFQMNSPAFTPFTGVPLEFDVTITYTGTDSPTPDQFSFAALDNQGFELPTTGPADALATFDITGAGVQIAAFGGDTGRTPAGGGGPLGFNAPVITDISGSAVPEPGSLVLLLPALALLVRVNTRRRLR